MVYLYKGFKFRFRRMQINVRRVKMNHLLFIAKDLTTVLNFETVIFYISVIYDFFFL